MSDRFYSISDVTHVHSNYESMVWNVLKQDRAASTRTFKAFTENVNDLDYNHTLISKDEAKIRSFIKSHMSSWAQDSNMYEASGVQIQQLRADLMVHGPVNKKAWDDLVKDYYAQVSKAHYGGSKTPAKKSKK